MELHGVEPDQGGVTTRIYIFWAISITAVGSAVATWLEAMEEYFVAEGAEAAAAAAARDGEPELGERANTARVAALEMKAKKDEALVEFSNLAQAERSREGPRGAERSREEPRWAERGRDEP